MDTIEHSHEETADYPVERFVSDVGGWYVFYGFYYQKKIQMYFEKNNLKLNQFELSATQSTKVKVNSNKHK